MLGKTWSKLLWAFATEMALWEDNLNQLLIELVPGLSVWLLPDWERNLGLPDECSPLAPSISQRQQIAHAKYTAKYDGMSLSTYEGIAAQYGSTIVIAEAPSGVPFRVDYGRVDRTPAEGINGARLNSIGYGHELQITIPGSDPNKDITKCVINKLKPAHTTITWVET